MKRSALSRHTPLSRGKPMERGGRLKPVNRKRKAKAFARNFGERAEAVRSMRCLVASTASGLVANEYRCWLNSSSNCFAHGRELAVVQAAHARARGMGGAKGDRRDLVPLCAKHHAEAGEYRTSQRANFEKRYGLDLVAEAERISVELDGRGCREGRRHAPR